MYDVIMMYIINQENGLHSSNMAHKLNTYAWSIKDNFPSTVILNIYSNGRTSNPDTEALDVDIWLILVRNCPMATRQLKLQLSSKSSVSLMFIFDVGHDFK